MKNILVITVKTFSLALVLISLVGCGNGRGLQNNRLIKANSLSPNNVYASLVPGISTKQSDGSVVVEFSLGWLRGQGGLALVWLPLAIGLGALLQAALGAWLVRRGEIVVFGPFERSRP